MRKIVKRSFIFVLLPLTLLAVVVACRVVMVAHTGFGMYSHLRNLLESGESIEGLPIDDVLSDGYLLSLFGDNPELVDRLKAVVDLGMASDPSLKLGSVSGMVVTYQKAGDGTIIDPAIYAIGGFPDPKSRRLGFHSSGYFRQEIDPDLWLTGNTIMNMMGRDIIIFCEQERSEEHMALLFDLLQGGIFSLAQRVVTTPLHYAIVFPNPKDLAPANLRNTLQTVIVRGEMSADEGRTETILVTRNARASMQTYIIFKDMATLARITFHDYFGGYIKEMDFGQMNDIWWAVEYVKLVDALNIMRDNVLVIARVEYDRVQNNVILKTIERAGRDLAMQKSYAVSGDLPWDFAFRNRESPSGGYWSAPHRWGDQWPLGDEGIPTPGSMAAAAERERIRAEQEAERERIRTEKESEREQRELERRQATPQDTASTLFSGSAT